MRKAPQFLALFLIIITFVRVSQFLSFGIKLGWLGFAFAVAVTLGVYVSGFFSSVKGLSLTGRITAILLLVAFGATDLLFNTLEMIRTLAPETLIGSGENFLYLNATALTAIMHTAALVYGVLPTLLAGGLGILQGQAEKVASLNHRSWIAAFFKAISATLQKGIVANLEERYHISNYRQIPSGNSGKSLPVGDDIAIDAEEFRQVRWGDLTSADKSAIAAMNSRQIMAKYRLGSERTARDWKARVEAGQ